MAFQKMNFRTYVETEMVDRSEKYLQLMKTRRTVREFSERSVPIGIVKNAVKTAASAPSGANKQPWHFVIVQDPIVKKEIRRAAEKEEKEFYSHRAPDHWLKDLNQFKTDWHKPFLEIAPYLIAVFRQRYEIDDNGQRKNYYVNESVGIASGFLLTSLHNAGLATLVHTPSPMGFLERILDRPKNERAFLLIPVGYPAIDAQVPTLSKKPFNDIASVI